jgi:hypothetical protein
VIDDSDVQLAKQPEPRTLTLFGISIVDDREKLRVNL